MKRLFSLITFCILSLNVGAHEYFFGFAELAYSSIDEVIEGTLMLSTHDVEEWFVEKNLPVKEMEDHVADQNLIQKMAGLLFSEFKLKVGAKELKFEMIGYEVLANGMTNFYFHSGKIDPPKQLDITFEVMMDSLSRQQNKVTYLQDGQSFISVFTSDKRQSTIVIK